MLKALANKAKFALLASCLYIEIKVSTVIFSRGYSSVGRAPALQAGGQEFDSPYLHHRMYFMHSGVEPWKLNKEEMNTKQIDNEKNVIERK